MQPPPSASRKEEPPRQAPPGSLTCSNPKSQHCLVTEHRGSVVQQINSLSGTRPGISLLPGRLVQVHILVRLELSPLEVWGPVSEDAGSCQGDRRLTFGPLVLHLELLFCPPGTLGWTPDPMEIHQPLRRTSHPGSCSGQRVSTSAPWTVGAKGCHRGCACPVGHLAVCGASYQL